MGRLRQRQHGHMPSGVGRHLIQAQQKTTGSLWVWATNISLAQGRPLLLQGTLVVQRQELQSLQVVPLDTCKQTPCVQRETKATSDALCSTRASEAGTRARSLPGSARIVSRDYRRPRNPVSLQPAQGPFADVSTVRGPSTPGILEPIVTLNLSTNNLVPRTVAQGLAS